MAALGNYQCSVCGDEGCSYCPKVSLVEVDQHNSEVVERIGAYTAKPEPFPTETFYGFTDSDIEQLIVDCSKELARRQGGSWFRRGPDVVNSRGDYPRMYQK